MQRVILRRAAAQAAAVACARRQAGSKVLSALRVQKQRLAPSARAVGAMRFQSTESRFLSLADEDSEDKAEGEGEEGSEGAEGEEEEGEGKDGELKLDEEADINEGGIYIDEELDEEMMQLFMENPLKWTPEKLARRFFVSKQRVEAILWLKGEEAELTPEEFRAKIATAKAKAQEELDAHLKKIADAEAAGDAKEVARLKKRDRQAEEEEMPHEELTAHEEAMLLGIDEDAYRNPEFFFLSDEFEGYPPLVRRMGKHGKTDKLYPQEALELQRLAGNNKITPQKSFANPQYAETPAKFRLAVKDISKKKKHLLVRDETRTLRMATNEEVLPRTWVRRPAFFSGLDA